MILSEADSNRNPRINP